MASAKSKLGRTGKLNQLTKHARTDAPADSAGRASDRDLSERPATVTVPDPAEMLKSGLSTRLVREWAQGA